MKSLSLKVKILLGAGMPLILFLALAFKDINLEYQHYKESTNALQKINFITLISKVIHETQKERGKTALFLNKTISKSDLKNQRSLVDKEISDVRLQFKNSGYSDKDLFIVKKNFGKYSSLREKINTNSISTDNALKSYTLVISQLLELQSKLASQMNNSTISTLVSTLRTLEDAKEAGGKLRAHMSATFSQNRAITGEKLNLLMTLKAGVDIGSTASSNRVSKGTQNKINNFKISKQWKNTSESYNTIISKYQSGDYEINGTSFFKTITSALNLYNDVIVEHRRELKNITVYSNQTTRKLLIRKSILYSILSAVTSILIFFVMKFSNESIEHIKTIGNSVENESSEVSKSSEQIASIASSLSEASIQQAATLQETVSSINEISSMVKKNTESIQETTTLSKNSKKSAQEGKSNMERMISSIEGISESNGEIMKEVSNNNSELQTISELIKDIEEKTKVINDIVFQTKLLSFNASVEAARAGEHGKGFAVVAEEIGNLANMSGEAALQISQIIETSVQNVQTMIKKTTTKMESITSTGKKRVDEGVEVAKECEQALLSILENSNQLDKIMGSIRVASEEQKLGIEEINKAMLEFDEVTNTNTSVANEASQTASGLNTKAAKLSAIITDMMNTVNGKKAA